MGRLLGIDYGIKRIGLAVTDEMRIIASPFATKLNNKEFWDYLDQLVQEYKITGFVLGKPTHDGENSFMIKVMEFAEKLNQKFGYPIYLQDESLSSQESRSFLIGSGKRGKKMKDKLDQYAAQAILTNFLKEFERGIIEEYKQGEIS